jgi:hypothetical protein
MGPPNLEDAKGWFILTVGALGLVLTVLGLVLGERDGMVAIGVIFVVACIMGEGLSHFAVGRGQLTMRSRTKPSSRRRS